MYYLFRIITYTVSAFVTAEMILLFVRMILSFVAPESESPAAGFVFAATEIVIAPVRAVLFSFDLFADSPIDVSFFLTALILSIVKLVV